MTKEKMNVHKALCELKILDSRITKEVSGFTPCGVTKAVAQRCGSVPVPDFVNDVRSKYDSINALISRRNAIKRAVTLSNAITKVVIDGVEYTVAEAIEMKNHGLENLNYLKHRIESCYADATYSITRGNNELDHKADEYIKSVAGGDKKVMPEEIQKMRDNYVEPQTLQLVDPLNSQKLISELSNEIDKFKAEVDSALSVSNAMTEIEIEY